MFMQSTYTLIFEDVTFSAYTFVQVLNIFGCARLCIETADCSSFFYSHSIKSCAVSTKRYRDTLAFTPQAGINYYSMRPDCLLDWDVMNDQCYKLSTSGAAADDAQLNCEAMGGYLAKADSEADNAVIKGLMAMSILKWPLTEVATNAGTASTRNPIPKVTKHESGFVSVEYGTGFWIGGTDADSEGTWIWRDGTHVTVDGWADGQPDASMDVDDCIEQWAGGNGWNDGQCWYPLLYLCEI